MPEADNPLPSHPVPPEPWLYGPRLIAATRVALEMHATQVRKGSDVPYASHLFGTCSIALDHGANEDQAIAALLHDAIEDVHYAPGARDAVVGVRRGGPADRRGVHGRRHPPQAALDGPQDRVHRAPRGRGRAQCSSSRQSDKLHNARSMVADHRRVGAVLWGRFKASRDETLWNYRALVTAFRANPAHPVELVDELDRTVTELERLAATEKGAPA